jgi:cytochrome P450
VSTMQFDLSNVLRSLLTPDGLADPYSVYEQLRTAQHAGQVERVLLDHADVKGALTDRRLSSERIEALVARLSPEVQRETKLVTDTLRRIIAFVDPPAHKRLRRLMTIALKARAVTARRSAIEKLTATLLDRIAEDGAADLFEALNYPLPAQVVGEILAIPVNDRARFEQWANDIVFYVGSGSVDDAIATRTQASVEEMHTYMSALVAERRRAPGDDLLSAMLAAEDDGSLTDAEVRANALFLMTAGHETATNMLSNGLLALLRHPDQLALLRSRPELIEAAIEEMLRFESPVQMTSRIATEEGVVAGTKFHAGESVLIVLGAANRDPAVFADPHRFDIERDELSHVAFGHGPHWCIGGSLAREEARTVIPMVLERLPGLELAVDEIEWQPTLNFRGPTSLPVRWSA